jgi:hypothetical protein
MVLWCFPRWNRFWTMYMTLMFLWWLFFVNKEATLWSRQFSHRYETRDTGHLETKKSYLSRWETESVRRYLVIYPSLSKINSVLREMQLTERFLLKCYRHTHTDSRRDCDRLWWWGVYEYTVLLFVNTLTRWRVSLSAERQEVISFPVRYRKRTPIFSYISQSIQD